MDAVVNQAVVLGILITTGILLRGMTNFDTFAVVAGVSYAFGIYLLYYSLKKEEPSRVASIVLLSPLFVMIFAFLFLGEAFSLLKYAAIIVLLAGAVVISLEKSKSKFQFGHVLAFTLLTAVFFAGRDFLMKLSSTGSDIFSSLMWFGIGGLVVHAVVFAFHHPHIIKKAKKGVSHIAGISILVGIAYIFYFSALGIQSASIVSSILPLGAMLVFVFATILSKFHPRFVKEKLDKTDIAIKAIGIALIVFSWWTCVHLKIQVNFIDYEFDRWIRGQI
ncbi:MAG: DMT family transporter [Candidatus Aenigmarchaeota archaeon]|nr:DMT family transporter [Candidatus Aenigmarchaeota archaeon]